MGQLIPSRRPTSPQKSILTAYLIALNRVAIGFCALSMIIGVIHFPLNVDAPLTSQEIESAQKYYADVYRKPTPPVHKQSEFETRYMQIAEIEAKASRIEEKVKAFAERFELADKAVLEIGSGRGYLQDIVQNYTGLDISPSVRRFYHKKFVIGSATAMPFPDNSFDGIWSIWVYEHVPNPEQAFYEARRVMRDGGFTFLHPGWMSTTSGCRWF